MESMLQTAEQSHNPWLCPAGIPSYFWARKKCPYCIFQDDIEFYLVCKNILTNAVWQIRMLGRNMTKSLSDKIKMWTGKQDIWMNLSFLSVHKEFLWVLLQVMGERAWKSESIYKIFFESWHNGLTLARWNLIAINAKLYSQAPNSN